MDIVNLLLAYNTDVTNIQKNDGWTALHLAASQGHESIARSLLARDAWVHSVTCCGEKPPPKDDTDTCCSRR